MKAFYRYNNVVTILLLCMYSNIIVSKTQICPDLDSSILDTDNGDAIILGNSTREILSDQAYRMLEDDMSKMYADEAALQEIIKLTDTILNGPPDASVSHLVDKIIEIQQSPNKDTSDMQYERISKYLEFSEEYFGTKSALNALEKAIGIASQLGDYIAVGDIKGHVVEQSISSYEKGKWALSQAGSYQKVYYLLRDMDYYRKAINKFDESIKYFNTSSDGSSNHTTDPYHISALESELNSKYEKANHLMISKDQNHLNEALVLFKEVLDEYDEIDIPVGIAKSLSRNSMLLRIFDLSCKVSDRHLADYAFSELQNEWLLDVPVSYYGVTYASTFFVDVIKLSEYLFQWYEDNINTDMSWYALFYSAERLYYSDYRERAYPILVRMREDCGNKMKSHELTNDEDPSYYERMIYMTAMLEIDHLNKYESAIELLNEYVESYPDSENIFMAKYKIKQAESRMIKFPFVIVLLTVSLLILIAFWLIQLNRRRRTPE